jgi:hypothetical protein
MFEMFPNTLWGLVGWESVLYVSPKPHCRDLQSHTAYGQLEARPVDEERPLHRALATMSGGQLSAGQHWLPPMVFYQNGSHIIPQNIGWHDNDSLFQPKIDPFLYVVLKSFQSSSTPTSEYSRHLRTSLVLTYSYLLLF